MHKSIAKAEIKGIFRKASTRLDELNDKLLGDSANKTKKRLINFNRDVISTYGDLLLFDNKINQRLSWHFVSELVAINPDMIRVEGVGDLCQIVIEILNTKSLARKSQGYQYLESNFFLHEHFLIRFLQRTNIEKLSNIGDFITDFIVWLSNNNYSFDRFGETVHLVFKNYVIVCTIRASERQFIFKTCLLVEKFTVNQIEKYKRAYEYINSKNVEMVLFIEENNEFVPINTYLNIKLSDYHLEETNYFSRTINL